MPGINTRGELDYVILFYYPGTELPLNFTEVKLPVEGIVSEEIAENHSRISKLNLQLRDGWRGMEKLLPELFELEIKYDALMIQKSRLEAGLNIASTTQTRILKGWIREDNLENLKKLESKSAVIIEDPKKGEDPPVDLKNKGIARSFELLIDMYSKPRYFELDPSIFMVPFFILFFAICLSDGGYGLMLMICSLVMLKKVRMGKDGKKLFKILALCGAITIPVGILMGGFFGDALGLLNNPEINEITGKLCFLNPVGETSKIGSWLNLNIAPQLLLFIFALILGIIYITFSYLIEFYSKIKDGRILDAIMDEGVWLCFCYSFIGIVVSYLLKGFISYNLIYFLLGSVIAVVLTKGRHAKSIFGKLGAGLGSLYSISGVFTDILSYCRLFALCLSTAVMAMVINQLAETTLGMGWIGLILCLVILIIGHLFTFLICALSAFIHTLRLHYIESLPKYLEGGGKEFKPFIVKTKYTKIYKENT